jgi:hypothetical protein
MINLKDVRVDHPSDSAYNVLCDIISNTSVVSILYALAEILSDINAEMTEKERVVGDAAEIIKDILGKEEVKARDEVYRASLPEAGSE